MKTTIKIEDIKEVDELTKDIKDKKEMVQEELLMFLKGVNLGEILARKKYSQEKETA